MKKLSLMVLVTFFMLSVVYSYIPCCASGTANAEEVAIVETINTVCPVTGMKIEKTTSNRLEYDGKIIGFCCPDCISKFEQDPKKYMDIVDKNIKSQ